MPLRVPMIFFDFDFFIFLLCQDLNKELGVAVDNCTRLGSKLAQEQGDLVENCHARVHHV
jgi:hypothetical protein